MEYKGSFRVGQQDNFRYNYFITKKKLWTGSIIVFAVILILTGLTRFGQSGNILQALLNTLPYALGGAVLLYVVNLLVMYMRLRTMYQKRQIIPFTQEIRFDREGTHASSENGHIDLPWKRLMGVTETRKDFYLMLDASVTYVIPKSQLEKPEDAETLREIFKAYAGKSQLRLGG